MIALSISLLFVSQTVLILPTTSLLIMKALHALKTGFSPLVLFLKFGDLSAHRMQLLKLILKALLLHLELMLFLFLLRVLSISHLLHCEGAPGW